MRISDWSSDVCSSDLPQGEVRHHIADMVAATGDLRAAAAVVIDGPDAQADARTAGQRPQVAHDGGGPERAAEMGEAWCEVGHLHDTVAAVVEARHQDGRIAAVMLLRADRKSTRLNSSH